MTDARLPEPRPWHEGMTLVTHPDGTKCWHRPPQWLDAARSGATPPPDGLRERIEGMFGWVRRSEDSISRKEVLRLIDAPATPPAAPDGPVFSEEADNDADAEAADERLDCAAAPDGLPTVEAALRELIAVCEVNVFHLRRWGHEQTAALMAEQIDKAARSLPRGQSNG